ncbi:MAG: hypothetical protein Q9M50_01255 [Methylococcales bacterium]|nr:hypothetical protein [Methylococcales bacterium]
MKDEYLDEEYLRDERKEGIKEGIEKGLEEGMEKGLEEGIEKGKKKKENAKAMINKGLELSLVSEITGFSKKKLQTLGLLNND